MKESPCSAPEGVREFFRALRGGVYARSAGGAHAQVVLRLRSCGWVVDNEPGPFHYTRNGRDVRGRIDLIACWGVYRIAVEIDARTPRLRSILKLRATRGRLWRGAPIGARVVLLRDSAGPAAVCPDIDGVDAVGLLLR